MTTQERLAAATIAKIFGSELLYAQQNARTDGGTTPDFGIVHPKDILQQGQTQSSQQRSQREQQMLQMLQREAEASCPLPQDISNSQQTQHLPQAVEQTLQTVTPKEQTTQLSTVTNIVQDIQSHNSTLNPLERIASSLDRIANCFEKIDFSVKRVRTKRKVQKNDIYS